MEKKNIRQLLSLFSDRKGRIFWNYCYSWGASLVIIGAMFKIMHFPYANQILIAALSIEALVFFLSAFDYKESYPAGSSNVPVQRVKPPEEFIPPVGGLSGQWEEYIRQQQLLIDHLKSINQYYEQSVPDHSLWQEEVRKMIAHLRELNRFHTRLLDTLNRQNPENPFTHV